MHRWLAIVIFAYLIFAPILSIIPKMEQPAVVVVLWVIIGAEAAAGLAKEHASRLTADIFSTLTTADADSPE